MYVIIKISVHKLKFYLFANLCSTFRKCSIDSIGPRHVVDVVSVWWRMCTVRRQHQRSSDFDVGPSYATETSSTGAGHDDDYPDLGDLDTTMDILSQLKDAPDTTQPSRARQPPHHFTPGSDVIVHHKRGRRH
jgi:hypothetical protein